MWRRRSARERRSETRKLVAWKGRCWEDTRGEEQSTPCTVIDVSPSGAAVWMIGERAAERDHTIVIEVEEVGTTPVMFRIHGIVRDVTPGVDGSARRVGLSLAIQSVTEQRILRAITSSDPALG